MNLRPRRLRGRLLMANLIVAGATLGTVLIGVSLIGPGYFQDAMGHRPGDAMGQAMDAATLSAFQEAIRTALVAAALTALVAAVVVSLAISARIAGPVSRLVAAARRIASGHYAERVPVGAEGEVGELASAFNQMSSSLEATERRRLELVGDVAHELRTPLTTLDGYLEGLQDGVVEPNQETWSLLRNETGRLTRLIGDLAICGERRLASCHCALRRSMLQPCYPKPPSAMRRRQPPGRSCCGWSRDRPRRHLRIAIGSCRSSATTSPTPCDTPPPRPP